jgi:L-iditol 2-dehydrogenase
MIGLFKTAAGSGNLEIRQVSVPEPGPGEVTIKVEAAGICGSDLHIYHWDINFPMRPPMIIGHEFSGSISDIGIEVAGWQVGDRVTSMTTAINCGRCRYCLTGFDNLCPERKTLGYWVDGAFAEYVKVGAHRVHRLPANVEFVEGALTEPLACCVHGVQELTGICAGDQVVISGPGTVGLLALQIAKAEGGRIVVTGTAKDQSRLALAKTLGADETVNINGKNAVDYIRSLSDGAGADVVLECSGVPAAAVLGLELVKKQGKYTQIGLFGRPFPVDFEKIAYKEIQVTGSLSQHWVSWNRALLLMAEGKVRLKPLISDIMPLTEWKIAFEKFEAREGVKIVLDPKSTD